MATSLVPAKQSLYELEAEYEALLDTEELVKPEQEEHFQQDLAVSLKRNVAKRDAFAQAYLHIKSLVEFAKKESQRLAKRAQVYQNALNRMDAYGCWAIQSLGKTEAGKYKKLEGETATIGVRRDPVSVVLLDEAKIPPTYKTLTITISAAAWEDHIRSFEPNRPDILDHVISASMAIDKIAIKKALEDGKDVAGADLKIDGISLSVR